MKNRAKCYKCKKIIESFTLHDYVYCECGEIGIAGGPYQLQTFAIDYANFMRVDDDDQEVTVTYLEKAPSNQENSEKSEAAKSDDTPEKIDKIVAKEQIIEELKGLLDYIRAYPKNVYHGPCTNADLVDLCSLLLRAIELGE